MNDSTIHHRISELVDEEKNLRSDAGKPNHNAERLRRVEEQLDQCWDLLRQRRAKREFGGDAETASLRDPKTVESYTG